MVRVHTPICRGDRRQLSGPQKKSYIDAVLCLTSRNAISGIAMALDHFDDYEAVTRKEHFLRVAHRTR